MIRPIRIGLIAEGEAELGASIPYINPEDGGKITGDLVVAAQVAAKMIATDLGL
jgi:hypothetical protein